MQIEFRCNGETIAAESSVSVASALRWATHLARIYGEAIALVDAETNTMVGLAIDDTDDCE